MSAEDQTTAADDLARMQAAFDRLKAGWRASGGYSYKERMALLKKLLNSVRARKDQIVSAISADFGNRARAETLSAEIWLCVEAIRHARTHLAEWMEPREPEMSLALQPATGKVVMQPLGVVGVIVPWNYPIQLSIQPLAAAVAAGNRVLIKPSELTPRTNEVMAAIVKDCFTEDQAAVVTGGAEVGAAFASLPFDHIFFTGSPRVGKLVMAAAAANLTPVTLELGGKTPVIVHESFSASAAAKVVAFSKGYNAGQTCVAPDYVLCPRGKVEEFVSAYQAAFQKLWPTVNDNPDYTSIISEGHWRRLQRLVAEAEQAGTRIVDCHPKSEGKEDGKRKMGAVLAVDPRPGIGIMEEEIFGPILPIVPVDSVDQAIAYVNDRPRPLSLYYFDRSGSRQQKLLDRTMSGSVCMNDCMVQNTQEELPFGGVGNSGMGSYHGLDGFRTFSHQRAVFEQSRFAGTAMLYPPYGKLIELVMKLFIR